MNSIHMLLLVVDLVLLNLQTTSRMYHSVLLDKMIFWSITDPNLLTNKLLPCLVESLLQVLMLLQLLQLAQLLQILLQSLVTSLLEV